MAYRASAASFSQLSSSSNIYKLITLGDLGVGKSSLIHTYIKGTCSPDTSVSCASISSEPKIVQLGPRLVQVEVWDTAGQERYDSIVDQYYRNIHGCFICFDISNPDSFRNVTNWLNSLHERLRVNDFGRLPPIILLGTKCDLRHNQSFSGSLIQRQKCEDMARKLNICSYLEVSAHTNQNVEKAFMDMIKLVDATRNRASSLLPSFSESIRIAPSPQDSTIDRKRSCCPFRSYD